MKEIDIKSFTHLFDAMEFLENSLFDAVPSTSEIDGEISFINGQWRVGVILNNRQKEINFD